MNTTRRGAILGLGTVGTLAFATEAESAGRCPGGRSLRWATGLEGQRRADLGDGSYLNPVFAGDHPDPSVLKDGDIYYKVSSSFFYYPGLMIWRSEDLVNWSPVTPALTKPVGSVLAPDLVKHEGRFYIYIAALNLPPAGVKPTGTPLVNYVVHADKIEGPWSDPVDVGIYDAIDPGHVVGEDGKRYIFVSGCKLVPISDDGLHRTGPTESVYDGWQYPNDWVVEGFSLEGPKLLRRDGWFYMFSAEGGTAGPPTSHMVIVARARSVRGPWENCPHNPIVRTQSAQELWWSRGHATPVEGPTGDWWLVYHGYENGFRTLGRQMLLQPFDWTADGWPRVRQQEISHPIPKPKRSPRSTHGVAFSDDFSTSALGWRWTFFNPGQDYANRIQTGSEGLTLLAQGANPGASSPLVLNVGDRKYEFRIRLDLRDGAQAGVLLFYNSTFFCGIGADERRVHLYKMGVEPFWEPVRPGLGAHLWLRVINNENIASFYTSADGENWMLQTSFEVAGYNHNVADGFLSLRPAIFVSGRGSATFRAAVHSALV